MTPEVEDHRITVPRTARYHVIGEAATARELWMVLHGHGQLARFFLQHFAGLAEDRLIAAPEALSRYYLDAAHQRVGATWMTREDREAEIADQAAYLNALAGRLLGRCPDGTPLNVLGFSQGVATACRWAMAASRPFRRLVLWGGTLPPELHGTGLAAGWKGLHATLVHGEADRIVGEDKLRESEARLREAGIPFGTVRFTGGHALDTVVLRRCLG